MAIKIYGDSRSGNCYKLQLVAGLLDLSYQWVSVDILAGEARTDEFKAKNPNAKIPLLEREDGELLAESNAILNYLATGSDLLPNDPWLFAQVLQWQFFEQYSHEPYIAVARFIAQYQGMPDERRAEYEAKQPGGRKALRIMDDRLRTAEYLVGEQLTTADISLYAYTHVAEEGGFSLADYPAIGAWLQRIEQTPGYVAMMET